MGDGKKRTDATRAERKAKKRKLEDAIPDVPGDDGIPETAEIAESEAAPAKKRKRDRDVDDGGEESGAVKEKKAKKEKKEKKKKDKNSSSNGEPAPDAEEAVSEEKPGAETENTVENGEGPKKSKKERKAERRAREVAEAAANKVVEDPAASSTTGAASAGAPVAAAGTKEKKPKSEKKKKQDPANGGGEKAARFIVFIGTLYALSIIFTGKHTNQANLMLTNPLNHRKPAIFSHDSVHPEALRIGEAGGGTQPYAEGGPAEVQGLRVPGVRRLRPHEDVPEALPPLDV